MTESGHSRPDGGRPLVVRVGREELVVRRRYETISIINDLMIGIWFLVGSVLFFSPALTRTGTWLFVLGSVQLLIRPIIRLTRNLHVKRVGATPEGGVVGSGHDF